MKNLKLILWVGQLGFSMLFPLCFFLILGNWLQNRFGLGLWVTVVLGILGFLTSASTTRSCIHSLMKDVREDNSDMPPPVSFNNHN